MKKISYANGNSETPLRGISIGDIFDETAGRFPEHQALVSKAQNVRLNYRQLQEHCDFFAQGLLNLGLAEGDRIGIWSPNCWEWVVVQIAAAKVGAILVNINPAYRANELEYALRQSGCKLVVIAPPYKTTHYADILNEVSPELAHSQPGHLNSERLPDLKTVIALGDQDVKGALHFREVFAENMTDLLVRQPLVDFDSAVNIQYTSGTTGSPKGATLSHHSMVNNALFVAAKMGMTEKDRYCVPLPFYHCAGMIMGTLAALATGAAVIIPAPAFDAEKTLEAIQSEKCTVLGGVPTLFIALLDCPQLKNFNLESMRSGFIGGSPCPVDVNRRIMTDLHIPELTIVFGMTELSPIPLQTCSEDPFEKRVGTVGKAHPHVEVKIVDPQTGKTVPRGSPGELCIRGYCVMLGYWANREATERTIDRSGWLHSGDLAQMDTGGYVNIVGRLKDMVIRGGENIYPAEIEELLITHPKVRDAQVIGVPDAKYGEELMAWVRPKSGHTLKANELSEFFAGKITHFKIPRYWRVTDEFPLTVSGKVQKFKLREMAIRELKLEAVAKILTS